MVEVLSPSTRRHDRGVKRRRYAALTIPHFWVVDPEDRSIACYRLDEETYRQIFTGEGDIQLTPADWPDLTISLGDLWR